MEIPDTGSEERSALPCPASSTGCGWKTTSEKRKEGKKAIELESSPWHQRQNQCREHHGRGRPTRRGLDVEAPYTIIFRLCPSW